MSPTSLRDDPQLTGRALYEAGRGRSPEAKIGPGEIAALIVSIAIILGPLAAGMLFWPMH